MQRYRARRADARLDDRLDMLDRPKPPERSYVGVYCPGCSTDVIPNDRGICCWCDRVIALWDGTPIHEPGQEAAA